MDLSVEIDVLKTVTAARQSLDPGARQRVLDYVCRALDLDPEARKSKAGTSPIHASGGAQNESGGKPASPQAYLKRYDDPANHTSAHRRDVL